MKSLVLAVALYSPCILEDQVEPWNPDPIVRKNNDNLPFEITARNADGTVDGIVTGADGRKHVRLRVPILEVGSLDYCFRSGSGVILQEPGP